MTRYLHFTLGPVQGFVAQARRTRDFWAGSFLLSYLSGVAMKVVLAGGGEVLFPEPDPGFLDWLAQPRKGSDRQGPTQGTVPNRFKAKLGKGVDPRSIEESVLKAWRGLAELVWREDLAVLEKGADGGEDGVELAATREVWRRQIEGFWEIAWVLTENEEANDLLDRRKLWRDHRAPQEPGIKCSIMDGWQELSGAPRPGDPRLESFWGAVQEHIPGNDLREGEQLCSLAFIKRRFAKHFESLEVPLDGWTLHGWKLPTGVPSVTYLAAAPWLSKVIPNLTEATLESFHKPASRLSAGYGEWHTDLRCLDEAARSQGRNAHRFRSLDGSVFFETNLDNEKVYPDRELARQVQKALAKVRAEAQVGAPSPFYAALMMDGDSLGQHLRDPGNPPLISQALAEFTRAVPGIVEQHSGFLVYAGGDDVLALLPLDWALECAVSLRRAYEQSFQGKLESTLSGALVLAHYRVPLNRVLRDVHRLLDEVAKEQRGRDSLAVSVQTLGASFLEWSMPWATALDAATEGDDPSPQLGIDALAREFAATDHEASGAGRDEPNERFSSGFFFRLGELFDLLNPQQGDEDDSILKPSEAVDLMTAEYLASGLRRDPGSGERSGGRAVSLERARQVVGRLLSQCRPVTHATDGEPRVSRRLEVDGGLLVRFLALERKGL